MHVQVTLMEGCYVGCSLDVTTLWVFLGRSRQTKKCQSLVLFLAFIRRARKRKMPEFSFVSSVSGGDRDRRKMPEFSFVSEKCQSLCWLVEFLCAEP
jgi:hypothetical protein